MYIARTKKEFERYFRAEVLPAVREAYEQDRRVDAIARREEWNNLVDALVQDRELPKKAIDWTPPY